MIIYFDIKLQRKEVYFKISSRTKRLDGYKEGVILSQGYLEARNILEGSENFPV